MSAQEFTRWCIWLDAEHVGPDFERVRHAQLLAAVSNSGHVARQGGGLFTAADFTSASPWTPPVKRARTAEEQYLAKWFDGAMEV